MAVSSLENFSDSSKLYQGVNGKIPILSSLQMGWNGILVEEHQYSPTPVDEKTSPLEVPALSEHWLVLPLGSPIHLSQRSNEGFHESIFQKGDSLFVPAGQATCWRCQGSQSPQNELHIRLQPKLIEQVAEASNLDIAYTLSNRVTKQDLSLQHIAMLLLTELRSSGLMGQMYVESLTQALVIHLLRDYSDPAQTVATQNRSLTHVQLQRVIDYIHTYLDQKLSLAELARVVNVSPNYFATLFKHSIGSSPHQYVVQQRVERARAMLVQTELTIADVATQVGFSSQSHLTVQFKRVLGVTPKQVR